MKFPSYVMNRFVHGLHLNRTSAVAMCVQKKLLMKEGTSERAADSLDLRGMGGGEGEMGRNAVKRPCLPLPHTQRQREDLLAQELLGRSP